ncbi:metal-dependent hydrolase [Acinetobacter sp. 187]|uniref:metal-dependent hydrolase n=1 Tax=Acinetobacter lanii TaxID=2715163 RepID=UPI00140923B8|nr:metal-dependent hydrolase [Acinetobacter lanii]NHC03094.1 metal-dependent hydrolase [Acinetobacter lanii]
MFIAHLPSGYLLAKFLDHKIKKYNITRTTFFSLLMIGAVLPDIDLFYFYLIDHRSVHHHKYFLHWFSFWIPIFLISYLYWIYTQRKSKYAWMTLLLSSAGLLHICLDTFVGDVWLFAPFIDKAYVFFEVTPRFHPWWLNFIFHWSFFVEIIICLIALFIYLRDRKKG